MFTPFQWLKTADRTRGGCILAVFRCVDKQNDVAGRKIAEFVGREGGENGVDA